MYHKTGVSAALKHSKVSYNVLIYSADFQTPETGQCVIGHCLNSRQHVS
jgi:hypothetical protein